MNDIFEHLNELNIEMPGKMKTYWHVLTSERF